MLLSNTAIRRHLEAGNIVIEPFVEANLGTCSYDVTLGPWYYREKQAESVGLYNLYDKQLVERVWGTEPSAADAASDYMERNEIKLHGIHADDSIIWISPGETLLCHSDEFIGGRGGRITTMMKARSSMGRNFIEICKDAGWGDIGYTNRWTMEVTNNSRYYTIPLVVGRRVAQIVFFETEIIENIEQDYIRTGKYQHSEQIEDLKRSWRPQMMLPRMYDDREARRR